MHIKSNGFKLLQIIKFARFVTLDNITYVRPRVHESLTWTRTLDVIVAPCALWIVITYVNTIGNDVL
jgi:hypothetical protein